MQFNYRILGILGVSSILACGGSQDDVVLEATEPTSEGLEWEEFLTMVYEEEGHAVGQEVFIVNGDEPIYGLKNLQGFFERIPKSGTVITNGMGSRGTAVSIPESNHWPLIVNTSGGVDTKWSDTQKMNLTYCVSTTFGSNYTETVNEMAAASAEWEAVADVDLIHVSSQDGNCTATNNNVLFDVRPVNAGGQYLARAFFPDSPRSSRNILIDGSSFTTSPPLTLVGILRHELGHVLGFRHEHTRPESGTCFEDNNWRPLTSYDSDSVMHYPQCNGTSDFSLLLTALDAAGAAALYGSPGSTPPPPAGEDITENFSGSVNQGEQDQFGPFSVLPGTTFTATMSGTGDPDLYVRFGSAPTTSSWDCRPYIAGASENCTLTVPAGIDETYVMIRGYTSGSYSLTVSYTAPEGSEPPPPPPPPSGPTEVTENYSGSVARREIDQYGPLDVVPGTPFSAVMTGSGDPDLYVRWGAPPTTRSYNCRPYLNGANETCAGTVPSGVTEAYFMVRGYRSSTYNVEVTYTTP